MVLVSEPGSPEDRVVTGLVLPKTWRFAFGEGGGGVGGLG